MAFTKGKGAAVAAANRFADIKESSVTSVTRFLSPRVKHLYDWWLAANEGRMPSRTQFDILDHKPIIENVFITDCRPDGSFVFRLLGEQTIQLIGHNPKGGFVDPRETHLYGHGLYEYYASIVRGKRPKRCVGSVHIAERHWKRFESIDCPLTHDGETVSTIIGVLDIIGDLGGH